jgi:hypothetical protein
MLCQQNARLQITTCTLNMQIYAQVTTTDDVTSATTCHLLTYTSAIHRTRWWRDVGIVNPIYASFSKGGNTTCRSACYNSSPGQFWLDCCRMNTICVQTFIDSFGLCMETLQGNVVNNNVGRGERFLLVQAPDVKFVNRDDAWNLEAESVDE